MILPLFCRISCAAVMLLMLTCGICRAEKLYWKWPKGDVYDVQLTSKSSIVVRDSTQQLDYETQTTIDGALVVQLQSNQGVADVLWTVSRVRIESGSGEQRVDVDTDQPAVLTTTTGLLASIRPLLDKQFIIRTNAQAAMIGVQQQQSDTTADPKTTNAALAGGPQLFTAEGVETAFRNIFISFPERDIQPNAEWTIPLNPLADPQENETQFGYRFTGLDEQSHQVVVITGKYAFPKPPQPSKVIKIEHQQLSGKLQVHSKQHYVTQLDLKLLLKTSTGEAPAEIKTAQSEIQTISIRKR